MNNELTKTAVDINERLKQLEEQRRSIAMTGFSDLERLDPETAALAINTFSNNEKASDWFTHEVQSLGGLTPWQCIAEGNRKKVHNILFAIQHGTFA